MTTGQQFTSWCQRGQEHPGLFKEEHHQQIEGGDPSALLSPDEVVSVGLCPVLSSPVRERETLIRASPGRTKMMTKTKTLR